MRTFYFQKTKRRLAAWTVDLPIWTCSDQWNIRTHHNTTWVQIDLIVHSLCKTKTEYYRSKLKQTFTIKNFYTKNNYYSAGEPRYVIYKMRNQEVKLLDTMLMQILIKTFENKLETLVTRSRQQDIGNQQCSLYFLKPVCTQNFLCATFYQYSSIFRTPCMKYVQTHFLRENLCALQDFLCALISRPVCARTQLREMTGLGHGT